MKEGRNNIGRFEKALETKEFIFFCDFRESDQNGSVKMYQKIKGKLDLLSNNYFGYAAMIEEIQKEKYLFIHETLNKYRKEIIN